MEITDEVKEQLKLWVEALRSGKYEQGKEQLQNKHTYCCLGVACKLFIPIEKQVFSKNSELVGGIPEDFQTHSPKWLKEINDDFEEKTGTHLSYLNDYGISFKEIAGLIEKKYINNN